MLYFISTSHLLLKRATISTSLRSFSSIKTLRPDPHHSKSHGYKSFIELVTAESLKSNTKQQNATLKLQYNTLSMENKMELFTHMASTDSVHPFARLFDNLQKTNIAQDVFTHFRRDLLTILENTHQIETKKLLSPINVELEKRISALLPIDSFQLWMMLWHNTSVSSVERIKQNETVHPVQYIDELKKRFIPPRATYCLYHNQLSLPHTLPRSPLVFVNVCLGDKIVRKIPSIWKASVPLNNSATHCTFYSIGTTEKGLAGLDLAHHLLKQVIPNIQQHHPTVTTFATISPIPNLRSWLLAKIAPLMEPSPETSQFAEQLFTSIELALFQKLGKDDNPYKGLMNILDSNWKDDQAVSKLICKPLMRLTARYLRNEKKRKNAFDPVCNFHIKNGAILYRINWLSDLSPHRMQQSFGMTVNYLYDLNKKEANSKNYEKNHEIAIGDRIETLLK